jgi:hypothetical protein
MAPGRLAESGRGQCPAQLRHGQLLGVRGVEGRDDGRVAALGHGVQTRCGLHYAVVDPVVRLVVQVGVECLQWRSLPAGAVPAVGRGCRRAGQRRCVGRGLAGGALCGGRGCGRCPAAAALEALFTTRAKVASLNGLS